MKLSGGEYLGEIIKRTELSGFRVLESKYRPHTRLPRHSHERARFSVLLQGGFTELFSKKSVDWKPFSFGFNISDEVHTGIAHRTGAHFVIIEVDEEWLQDALGGSAIGDRTTIFRDAALTCLVARLYTEVRHADRVSPIAIEGIALELMAQATRMRYRENSVPRWLKQAEEIIHESFTQTLSLSVIAEAVGVHPVHLARVFRQHHRSTIGGYVRELRIQFACNQLATSESTFSQIALAAGFYDQAHLSRIFKRQLGMTPAQYRSLAYRC